MEKYILRESQIEYKNYKKVKSLVFKSPETVFEWFESLKEHTQEKFYSVYMNSNNEVICFNVDFIGGIQESVIDIRIVIRNAILNNAVAVVFIHNHPSGNANPSTDDDAVTEKLCKACESVQIRVLDHIVIGDDCFYSYSEHSKINQERW